IVLQVEALLRPAGDAVFDLAAPGVGAIGDEEAHVEDARAQVGLEVAIAARAGVAQHVRGAALELADVAGEDARPHGIERGVVRLPGDAGAVLAKDLVGLTWELDNAALNPM